MEQKKWETVSYISTLVSTLAAIAAITIGIYQFTIAIEKTDRQIAYIDEEKRPNLAITETSVTNGYAASNDWWGYNLSIKNIGGRSAYKITVVDVLVSVANNGEQEDFTKYECRTDTSEYANSLSRDGILNHEYSVAKGLYVYHYVRSDIFYHDIISKRLYQERYYFRVFLDEHIKVWVKQDKLEGLRKTDSEIIDQMIDKRFPSQI